MENSDNFMSRIKNEKITPIPKWRFTYKNTILWSVIFFATILGAVAFSIILFAVQQIEFNLIMHMAHSSFEMWLALLPFLWIISLIVFLLVSIFGLRKTRKGYKFSVQRIIIGSAVLSILLGTVFFIGGGAKWLENAFAVNVSIYESVKEKKARMWSAPEEGYLSGMIHNVSDSSIQLLDFNENTWTIDMMDAKISRMVSLEEGEKIKIIGNITEPYHFRAEEIRPWSGFGKTGNRKNDSE
ncbi:MAG: hypothetical protein ABFS05_03885 [Bacteroidota bacterium]